MKLLASLKPPLVTTAQRDAIPAGRRPPGSLVWNTTTSKLNVNTGTDAVPVWGVL